jgi:hypothetical protein
MLRSCRLTSEAEITYPPDHLQVSPRLANATYTINQSEDSS